MDEEKLKDLPDQPGVYLMKNEEGKVIYVGKAVSLRRRVRSYFQKQDHPPKVQALVERIRDVEYIVTDSELEALILECNLIKEYSPWYNIQLRDDKSYPYIKVTTQERFPRIYSTRRPPRDGSRLYGPFADAQAVNSTLSFLKKHFPLRTCRKKLDGERRDRPCLNYHIKRCLAPCAGKVSEEDYQKIVEAACKVLEGKDEEVMADLERQMKEAAAKLDFEQAAILRDRIADLKAVTEKQKVEAADDIDRDVVGMACKDDLCCLQVFLFRGGKLIGRQHFLVPLEKQLAETHEEILAAFLKQYYSKTHTFPKEILLPARVDEEELLARWLEELGGRKVYLRLPQRGEKKKLLDLANRNAEYALNEAILQRQRDEEGPRLALQQLAEVLGLDEPPARIEAYDISNLQGTDPVAAMVVFENGLPAKEEYRRFKMKSQGPNDYAMMAEVITRRFKRGLLEQEEGGGKFARFPDLVLIDGGAGQLNAALEAMRKLGVQLPAVGLAEREEELYQEGKKEPLALPDESQALQLLRRIRDEAHRFAVTFHRSLRQKRTAGSILDEIEGVGPARRKALIRHFGSARAVSAAALEELEKVPGISPKLAQRIYDFFHS